MVMVQTADQTNQPVFPEYASPTDWPWTLSLMVGESRRILSYIQNLPKSSMPPQSIWHSPTKCSDYIDEHMAAMTDPKRRELLEFEEPEIQ